MLLCSMAFLLLSILSGLFGFGVLASTVTGIAFCLAFLLLAGIALDDRVRQHFER